MTAGKDVNWVDPRLQRPPGWSPPKPTEADYARTLRPLQAAHRAIVVHGYLSTLVGIGVFATACRRFYTDSVGSSTSRSSHWSPWRDGDSVSPMIRSALPYVDAETRNHCEQWLADMRVLEGLNRDWAEALARFFGRPSPESTEDYQDLHDQLEAHRRAEGASWLNSPDFHSRAGRLEQAVNAMQQLLPELQQILEALRSRYTLDDLHSFGGDQRVKDQIDWARGEPSHKRAINRLNRALRLDPSNAQVRAIYEELGFRYAELRQNEQAIEFYTKAMEGEAGPSPLGLFWRGELYFRLGKWTEAIQDFEKAMALGLDPLEQERAERYTAEAVRRA